MVVSLRLRPLCSSCRVRLWHKAYSSTTLAHDAGAANIPKSASSKPTREARVNESTKKVVVKEPTRNILEQSKVQDYLDFVAATKDTITLADIERYRPPSYSTPGTLQYEADYNALLDNLVRSFSGKQLRIFLDLYKLSPPTKRTKWYYAVQIIEEQWHWPSLTQIQKEQRDWSEVAYESFPLDARQSFLLLGKDGADLLSLSKQYNVHISFSAHPLSLKVEGLRGALDRLSKHIVEFKKNIEEKIFMLPAKKAISPDLLQRISRLSGAFTENLGGGLVRISCRSGEPRAIFVAERLATRAASEDSAIIPVLSYIPSGTSSVPALSMSMLPRTYSLYPFLSPRALPWMENVGGIFRARRVGEWLRATAGEDIRGTGGLAEGKGTVMALDGQPGDIKQVLLDNLPELPQEESGSSRVITASLGHLLVCSPPDRGASLVPPLTGVWQLSRFLNWMQDHPVKRVFSPSLPTRLLNSPPSQPRLLHRLVYRALLNDSEVERAPRVMKIEILLPRPEDPTGVLRPLIDGETNRSDTILTNDCRVGSETTLYLMIPDRPMDIRFSAFDFVAVTRNYWPQQLQDYCSKLQSFLSFANEQAPQPDAPLSVTYQGVTYILQSSSSVRQSFDSVSHPLTSSGLGAYRPSQVTSESILDLESNQKSTVCQVTCSDFASENGWKIFLGHCDRLSASIRRHGTLTSQFNGDTELP